MHGIVVNSAAVGYPAHPLIQFAGQTVSGAGHGFPAVDSAHGGIPAEQGFFFDEDGFASGLSGAQSRGISAGPAPDHTNFRFQSRLHYDSFSPRKLI